MLAGLAAAGLGPLGPPWARVTIATCNSASSILNTSYTLIFKYYYILYRSTIYAGIRPRSAGLACAGCEKLLPLRP